MRDAFIFHVASGQAFFSGVAMVSLAVLLSIVATRRWVSLGRTIAACAGLLLIAASATPLPLWFYAVGGTATLTWIIAERGSSAVVRPARWWLRGGVLIVWWLGVVLERPYHRTPTIPRRLDPAVYVVADSLGAGLGGETTTWPRLLAREHGLVVHDLSVAGATLATAARDQAGRVTQPGALVIAEIGGNDILAGTAPTAFERALDALLARLSSGGRTVVMLELPLPPFFNRYGAIQRRQARRHRVVLVPKRLLLGVLTTRGATLDTIHLSRSGHEAMAAAVWNVLRLAYDR